jgi:hypothetical protein
MLTRCLPLAATLVALASPLAAQATHPDFTGTWVLDASKTVVDGPIPPPPAASYVVVQVGDSLAVDQKMTSQEGEQVAKKVWRVDGKPWANAITYGGVDMVLSSTLSWNGAVLTIHTTSDYQGTPAEQTETWTLGSDGKTLTQSTSTSANGDYYATMTLVFSRK